MKLPQIVLVDSDISFAHSFINEFKASVLADIHHFLTYEEAYKNISDLEPDFIITEYNLSDYQHPNIISDFNLRSPVSKIVVISNQTDVNIIEELYNKGAFKYFRKEDFQLHQIKSLFDTQNNLTSSESPLSKFAC